MGQLEGGLLVLGALDTKTLSRSKTSWTWWRLGLVIRLVCDLSRKVMMFSCLLCSHLWQSEAQSAIITTSKSVGGGAEEEGRERGAWEGASVREPTR